MTPHPNQHKAGHGAQIWPPADVARLKQLVTDGLAPTAIARVMGRTRCSIIGKLDRIRAGEGPGSYKRRDEGRKLMSPAAKSAQAARAGRMAQAKRHAKNNNPADFNGKRVQSAPAPEPLPTMPACTPRVTIEDLTHRHCRYIGDRPALITIDTPLYCGQRTAPNSSWCPAHRALVYRPVPQRQQVLPVRR